MVVVVDFRSKRQDKGFFSVGARVSTSSNMVRQNRIPAGFLSELTVENGLIYYLRAVNIIVIIMIILSDMYQGRVIIKYNRLIKVIGSDVMLTIVICSYRYEFFERQPVRFVCLCVYKSVLYMFIHQQINSM